MRRLTLSVLILSGLISVGTIIGLTYLLANDGAYRPPSQPFWMFWLPYIGVAGNVIYIAIWAVLTTYTAEEQTLIRRVQFHPVLETRFIKSVDKIGEEIQETETIAEEYSKLVTGQPAPQSKDIDLRYLILLVRNQGQGIISRVEFDIEVIVPQTTYKRVLKFAKELQLAHNEQKAYVVTPIWNFPRFEVALKSLKYSDFFGEYNRAAGEQKIAEQRPFAVPENRKNLIFLEEFTDLPRGKGWVIDYWGKGEPSDLMRIVAEYRKHVLVFRGNQDAWDKVRGNKNQQSGAFLDFTGLPPETTFEISARVRSEPGTTGKFKLWCHDIHWLMNSKDRDTGESTPPIGTEFETVSMLYTTTNSGRLRIHLHYVPGDGAIEIDGVILRQLVQ